MSSHKYIFLEVFQIPKMIRDSLLMKLTGGPDEVATDRRSPPEVLNKKIICGDF